MYESFYGFREKPFSLLPDPHFFYFGKKHRKTLIKFRSGVMDYAGITLITGEIGCGKTTLVQYLKSLLKDEVKVGLITNTHRAFGDLLRWILNAFEIEVTDTSNVMLHHAFVRFIEQEHRRKCRTLLIIDEAQNLNVQLLEELRLLSNVNIDDQMFQIILVGQPELRDVLRRPDMIQFVQRIAVEHHVEPLDQEDTHNYIRHRLKVAGGDPDIFEEGARELIFRHSRGVPRLINSLSDTALLYGYDEKLKIIDTGIVHEIVFNETRYDYLGLGARELAIFGQNDSDSTAWTPNSKFSKLTRSTKLGRFTNSIPQVQPHEATLVVFNADKMLGEYPLQGDCFTIGRAQENDIHLPSPMISRIHARFTNSQEGVLLEDLTSVNGTFVNDQQITTHMLQEDDIIKIGEYTLNYKGNNSLSQLKSKKTQTKHSLFGRQREANKGRRVPPVESVISANKAKLSASHKTTRILKSSVNTKEENSPQWTHSKERNLDDVLKTLSSWLD